MNQASRVWVLFVGFMSFFGLFSTEVTAAQAKWKEIDLQSSFELVSEPLTLERVWKDKKQINAPLQRWFLERETLPLGLEAVPKPDGSFGVQVQGVLTRMKGYVRGPGPWFHSLSDFPCGTEPDPWFETAEGARQAVGEASQEWAGLLSDEKVKLSILLSRRLESTQRKALQEGERIFHAWLDGLDEKWRSKSLDLVRRKEWKNDSDAAVEKGLCTKGNLEKVALSLPKSLLEPLTGSPLPITKLLARAPARRWNGLFSVRVNVYVGTRTLSGQFLVDSSARRSVISPIWLATQGVIPALIEIPDAPLQRVSWSGDWEDSSTLGKPVRVDRFEISNLILPFRDFLLAETEFFGPPESVSTCCDGVLGLDFLRAFPTEFQVGIPYEIRIWPKEKFQWALDTPWVEVTETPQGRLVSPCISTAGKSSLSLPGVSWETGSEASLSIHTPWQARASKVPKPLWEVQCDSLLFASGVRAQFPKPLMDQPILGSFAMKSPATTIGMELLGRGNFTLDLPHGRIWFSKEALNAPPLELVNRSGLKVRFGMLNGERQLLVMEIAPRSPAGPLALSGLKRGIEITQINDKDPRDLDEWEVERYLAGAYGSILSFHWNTKHGPKSQSIDLSPPPQK